MTYQFNEDQEAWLHDLETTDAEQTTGVLHVVSLQRQAFCCLGRACVILKDKLKLETQMGDKGEILYETMYAVLPSKLMDALKLRSPSGEIVGVHVHRSMDCGTLVDFNDNAGMSFKEIAAFIRQNPERVFIDGAINVKK